VRPPEPVIWHDLECHGYQADLPLWRELAGLEDGPVLDVGAGTGRVALDLAAGGHDVVALDIDPVLLGALRERGTVETVVADAEDFALGREFGLILMPMQTIQLLRDRAAFFATARRHLRPGGLLAVAIADVLEAFEPGVVDLPLPETGEHDGWKFASQPIALRLVDGRMRIERMRTIWAPDGRRTTQPDAIDLAPVDAELVEREAAAHGFAAEPRRAIAPTDDYVGTTVVMLRG
jgi:SAM-dependent methyltransferase